MTPEGFPTMLIRTNINERFKETELHVCKDTMDDEVRRIVGELHAMYDPSLSGTDEAGNALHPGDDPALFPEDFVRSVLASTNSVPAETVATCSGSVLGLAEGSLTGTEEHQTVLSGSSLLA